MTLNYSNLLAKHLTDEDIIFRIYIERNHLSSDALRKDGHFHGAIGNVQIRVSIQGHSLTGK